MGNDLNDMLNVTMKRLEIVMQDVKVALENKAEKLIGVAILLLDGYVNLEMEKKVKNWEILFGYAKELYIQIIVQIPETGKTGQYLQAQEVMEEILTCKRNLSCLMV